GSVSGGRGVHAAGDTVAVWGDSGVALFDLAGRPLGALSLGVGRKPVVAAVAPDGQRIAIVDDGGALHVYDRRGQPVFRVTSGLTGTVLAWGPDGAVVYVGGAPIRVFRATDGVETVRFVLSPDGPIEELAVAADGTIAAAQANAESQVLRRIASGVLD
ncbi:MAG: hypothetical protein ABMB14_18310, partial [Myxococcota bacterium]